MSLAKVTLIKLVKVHHYGLCDFVAAYYIKSMVVCVLLCGSMLYQVHSGACAVCCAEFPHSP